MSGFAGPINTLPVGVASTASDLLLTWQGSGSSPFTRQVSASLLVSGLTLITASALASQFASPPAIGNTAPNTGAFTTIAVSGQITSTVTTGTAPFNISSTTNVANLNASSLNGATFASPGAIGSLTPGSASFTSISASSTVSGAGFIAWAASPPAIGSTTPSSGAFTTLSSTGAFTPSQTAGIVGTTTNNSANAGSIGEVTSSVVAGGSAVPLLNATPANVTTLALTAGDWDVYGNVGFLPNGTTTITALVVALNTTSATQGSPGNGIGQSNTTIQASFATGGAALLQAGTIRLSLSTSATAYLIAQANFGASTMSAYGNIWARRRR